MPTTALVEHVHRYTSSPVHTVRALPALLAERQQHALQYSLRDLGMSTTPHNNSKASAMKLIEADWAHLVGYWVHNYPTYSDFLSRWAFQSHYGSRLK